MILHNSCIHMASLLCGLFMIFRIKSAFLLKLLPTNFNFWQFFFVDWINFCWHNPHSHSVSMGFSLRPDKWNFFSLASWKRTSRTAKEQLKELMFSLILIFWDIYIAKSLQPKKVIVLDNNDCCKGWTLNGTLQKDFSSAIFAEPKPFCKVPLRVHPLPHSFLSTKRTILTLPDRVICWVKSCNGGLKFEQKYLKN